MHTYLCRHDSCSHVQPLSKPQDLSCKSCSIISFQANRKMRQANTTKYKVPCYTQLAHSCSCCIRQPQHANNQSAFGRQTCKTRVAFATLVQSTNCCYVLQVQEKPGWRVRTCPVAKYMGKQPKAPDSCSSWLSTGWHYLVHGSSQQVAS